MTGGAYGATPALPEMAEDVSPVAVAALGREPVSISQVPSFAGNRVFRVVADRRASFFKFGAAEDIAREHAALGLAAAAGVPVPKVEAVDASQDWSPFPVIVLREVPGQHLEGSEPEFRQVGGLMARWHAVALDGFGTAVVGADGLRGEDANWAQSLRNRAASAVDATSAGLVPLDRFSSLLSIETGCLLHGDFHPRHVYASSGHISAVIDWGDATVGDPDYDLARILHAGMLMETSKRR